MRPLSCVFLHGCLITEILLLRYCCKVYGGDKIIFNMIGIITNFIEHQCIGVVDCVNLCENIYFALFAISVTELGGKCMPSRVNV